MSAQSPRTLPSMRDASSGAALEGERGNMRMRRTLGLAATLFAALTAASPLRAEDARMVVLEAQDISGHVFKRLGLPNQDYCWQQCLKESRCTGVRWGVIAGATAGQCQLISGELTYSEPHVIRTSDGQEILVTASRKEPKTTAAPESGD